MYNKKFILFLLIIRSLTGENFNYTKIESIPDLSFIKKVYTGLDVLEQMDFSHLKGKTISILCNQALSLIHF